MIVALSVGQPSVRHLRLFFASLLDPPIFDADDPISRLRNSIIMGNHNNGLMEFNAGGSQKEKHILAGFTIQISSRWV